MTADFDLRRIIHPITPETFFAEHWEKKPLHVRRDDAGYFKELLTLEDVDRVITSLGLHHPRIEMTNAKKPITTADYTFGTGMIDATRLYQHFADGATVILPQLDWTVSSLAHICRAMEREINARFQTNVYLTPGGDEQGFKTHYDSHDVFVIQVSGSKRWRVYDTPIELPYRGQAFDPETTKPADVTMEFDMLPGDVFYLPRGAMHDAQTRDGGSLHITLGVLFTSWTDLLVEAIAQVGIRDAAFRRGLPPGYARDGFDRTAARETFKDLIKRFADQADFDQAIDHFVSDIVDTRHPLLEGQMAQVMRLGTLDVDSIVGCRDHLFARIETNDDFVFISCHGRDVRLPRHAEASVRYVLGTPRFRVGDLDGDLDDAGKLVLVRKLILEGMAHFVD